MNLPKEFVTRIQDTFPGGGDWLQRLPGLISEAAARWDLETGEAVPCLSYNYVTLARRRDGTECILKIGVPNNELSSEIATLKLYNGDGACKLYEADAEAGMLLLERLYPGKMLLESGSDDEQTSIAARVMKKLWKPHPGGQPLLTLSGWFEELKHLRPRFHGGTGPFPRRLVETVEGLLPDLFREVKEMVVLHGDCHHFNILSSERGWLVIDPKGVVGPAGYEPAPLLINPVDGFLSYSNPLEITRRRIQILSEELGMDPIRLHAWAVCHSLLSAWWDLTDSGRGGEYAIACGELFLQVKL